MDSHKLYSCRYADGRYTVSIANRACVEEAIAALCRDLDIRSAAITGIGAVDEATLRFYNPATKRYVDRRFEEQMEIAGGTPALGAHQRRGRDLHHTFRCRDAAPVRPRHGTQHLRLSIARRAPPARNEGNRTLRPVPSLFIPHNNSRLRQRHEDNRMRYSIFRTAIILVNEQISSAGLRHVCQHCAISKQIIRKA